MEDSDSEDSVELFPFFPNQSYGVEYFDDPNMASGVIRAVILEDYGQVEAMIKSGMSSNINDNHGFTPLQIAVCQKKAEMVKFLLKPEFEVRINSQNFCGNTALYLAVRNNCLDICTLLIEAGANVNLSNNEDVTPLHLASDKPEIAHLLIKNGALLNCQDYSGDTPLHEALHNGCIEVVYMLLYYNADANIKNHNNLTPFLEAVVVESPELQEALLYYVDDYNLHTIDGISTLRLALMHNSPFIEELIQFGAEVNLKPDLNFFSEMLQICLRRFNERNFSLIFDKLNFPSSVAEPIGFVLQMCNSDLDSNELLQYFQAMLNSSNLEALCRIETLPQIKNLIKGFFFRNIPFEELTKIIMAFCSYGYPLTSKDLYKVFEFYGFCELFHFLTYMCFEVETLPFNEVFPNLIYDMRMIDSIVNNFLTRKFSAQSISFLEKMLPYFFMPRIVQHYLCYVEEGGLVSKNITNFLEKHAGVPLLKDLCRNVVRDYLIVNEKLYTSCKYATFIDHSCIPKSCRQMLKYEYVIYK